LDFHANPVDQVNRIGVVQRILAFITGGAGLKTKSNKSPSDESQMSIEYN
jgi:hypothetical protein